MFNDYSAVHTVHSKLTFSDVITFHHTMLHLSVVVFVLALLVCSISQYNNCRCVSAASAPIAPPSRILAIKRCNFAADGDVSGGQSSVTEIVDTIVQKVVSIRGGKVEL